MAGRERKGVGKPGAPALAVDALDVHYGRAHVLQAAQAGAGLDIGDRRVAGARAAGPHRR